VLDDFRTECFFTILFLYYFKFFQNIFFVYLAALDDLKSAIELSQKFKDNRVLALALVQRGTISRLQGRNDDALDDFKMAASIGNSFARQQTVAMNPYAALCNQALSEIMRKEKAGQC
jgi:hypothetical protein